MAESKPGIIAVILSVLASAFGVQTGKNYQRDFAQASAVRYVVVGVVFVVLFIFLLIGVVRLIVPA
ncbi:DUF2970 domain-containing protein [Alteromonas sp. CYL-A6]|uniref:DUF2970 domain-containing protein n=1 Tax=Alteromonas nitratireducens TaxID=3390813 RepID=UPI0034AD329A